MGDLHCTVSSVSSIASPFQDLMSVPNLDQTALTSQPSVIHPQSSNLSRLFPCSELFPSTLGSALGNRQLICYRESEKRKTERESEGHPWIGSIQLLPLPHSHRDSAWAGVSARSGPVKYKPLSSQTLIPTRNTLLIPLRDPLRILLLLRWKRITGKLISACKQNNTALWQLSSTLLKRTTPPEIIHGTSGCTQLWSCAQPALCQ